MKEKELVYHKIWKKVFYIDRITDKGIYFLKAVDKLREGKPPVSYTCTNKFNVLEKVEFKKKAGHWLGTLIRGEQGNYEIRRITVTGDTEFDLTIEKDDKSFTTRYRLSITELRASLDFFLDDLNFDIYMDDDFMGMVWPEEEDLFSHIRS